MSIHIRKRIRIWNRKLRKI